MKKHLQFFSIFFYFLPFCSHLIFIKDSHSKTNLFVDKSNVITFDLIIYIVQQE